MSSTRNRLRLLSALLLLFMLIFSLLGFSATIFFAKRGEAQTILQLYNHLKQGDALQPFLASHALEQIDKVRFERLKRDATPFITNDVIAQFASDVGMHIYLYNNRVLLQINTSYFLRSESLYAPFTAPFVVAALLFLALIALLYRFMRQTLRPIAQIQENIARFERKEALLPPNPSDNELEKMSYHFYCSIGDIQALHEQRNLFIRAIMHELKTPLTKARFLTHFLPQEQNKEDFERLFSAMQKELDKLHDFEILNHHAEHVSTRNVNVCEVIEEAISLLLIAPDEVNVTCEATVLEVHQPSLLIVVKNLIDNAHKYRHEGRVEVQMKQHTLQVKNSAKGSGALALQLLTKPFTQGEPRSAGIGIGLYLIQRLCEQFQWELRYDYRDNSHIFSLHFTEKVL